PAAFLVAAPVHGVTLRARPPFRRPHEAAAVAVLLDALVGLAAGVEGKAVAGADPGDVELADPGAGADLPGVVGEAGGGPQPQRDVPFGQAGGDLVEVLVAAAVAVVDEHPAEGDLPFDVAIGHLE